MRNFDSSIDGSDLIDGFDFGAESTMNAKDFSIDDGSDGEVVEDFSAILPRVRITIFSVDFIIETIYCSNLPESKDKLPRLMVSS